MEPLKNSNQALSFLDPDLYSMTNNEEIDPHFVCVMCCGVVLEPVECKECQSLYCKGCLKTLDMTCPKRCGSNEYSKVNRFITNTLNKLQFKCQFAPKCEEKINYESYTNHFNKCEHGKPPKCENEACEHNIRNMSH